MKLEDKYSFIMYHPLHCARCEFSKRYLKGFKVTDVLLDDRNQQLVEEFRNKGYQSFPVIQVFEGENMIDEWNNLNIKKLEKYTRKK